MCENIRALVGISRNRANSCYNNSLVVCGIYRRQRYSRILVVVCGLVVGNGRTPAVSMTHTFTVCTPVSCKPQLQLIAASHIITEYYYIRISFGYRVKPCTMSMSKAKRCNGLDLATQRPRSSTRPLASVPLSPSRAV